jgi:hypothetical protein
MSTVAEYVQAARRFNELAAEVYPNRSPFDALEAGLCIACGFELDVRTLTDAEIDNWETTLLCPRCKQ